MYANQIEKFSQLKIQSTTLAKDEAILGGAATFRSNLSGRILTYYVVGTFGLLSPVNLYANAATANWHVEISDACENATDTSVSESVRDIMHIRKVMKLSVSEIARVFDVSRQAVHEWIKGGALSVRNAQRLSELAQAADVFVESGIEVTPQMLRRKIGSGNSLLESVKESGKVIESARTLADTLARESQQRLRLATRLAGRQKPVLIADDFGAPYLNENA